MSVFNILIYFSNLFKVSFFFTATGSLLILVNDDYHMPHYACVLHLRRAVKRMFRRE